MRKFDGYMRGVNLGGWISQYVERTKEHYDTFITEADIREIASWGMDHVRVPVDYDMLLNEDLSYNEDGFAYIDRVISWCRANGLHMILDLHKTYGYSFDPLDDTDKEAFFTDERLISHFVGFWKELARRYGKENDVVAFELLNEIISPSVSEEWNKIVLRAIEAIREYAPETYIVFGGVIYNNVSSVPQLADPVDDYIVYNFHSYDPLPFTHQAAYWVSGMPSDFKMDYPMTIGACREAHEKYGFQFTDDARMADDEMVGPQYFEDIFAEAIASAEKRNVPLYCGEYGVIDQAELPGTSRWLKDIHSVFEKHGIGRALWNYKNKDFGIVDPHYAEIKNEMIENM